MRCSSNEEKPLDQLYKSIRILVVPWATPTTAEEAAGSVASAHWAGSHSAGTKEDSCLASQGDNQPLLVLPGTPLENPPNG